MIYSCSFFSWDQITQTTALSRTLAEPFKPFTTNADRPLYGKGILKEFPKVFSKTVSTKMDLFFFPLFFFQAVQWELSTIWATLQKQISAPTYRTSKEKRSVLTRFLGHCLSCSLVCHVVVQTLPLVKYWLCWCCRTCCSDAAAAPPALQDSTALQSYRAGLASTQIKSELMKLFLWSSGVNRWVHEAQWTQLSLWALDHAWSAPVKQASENSSYDNIAIWWAQTLHGPNNNHWIFFFF